MQQQGAWGQEWWDGIHICPCFPKRNPHRGGDRYVSQLITFPHCGCPRRALVGSWGYVRSCLKNHLQQTAGPPARGAYSFPLDSRFRWQPQKGPPAMASGAISRTGVRPPRAVSPWRALGSRPCPANGFTKPPVPGCLARAKAQLKKLLSSAGLRDTKGCAKGGSRRPPRGPGHIACPYKMYNEWKESCGLSPAYSFGST